MKRVLIWHCRRTSKVIAGKRIVGDNTLSTVRPSQYWLLANKIHPIALLQSHDAISSSCCGIITNLVLLATPSICEHFQWTLRQRFFYFMKGGFRFRLLRTRTSASGIRSVLWLSASLSVGWDDLNMWSCWPISMCIHLSEVSFSQGSEVLDALFLDHL